MRLLISLPLLLALAAPAAGQTVTVDLALDDFMDFGGAQTVADLPGPDGHVTFREAVTAVNNTPGPQTIAFAIPTSEWSIFYADRALIRLENMLYLSAPDTTIDFRTQTAFTGDTNPAGGEVALQYAGPPASIPCLWLASDHCTVFGLGNAFGNNFGNTIWISGNHNRLLGSVTNGLLIRGDYADGGRFNQIGGVNPGEGNVFAEGVDVLSDADDNVLVGNVFRWGLRISGDTLYGLCDRNRVGGPTAAERNVLAGHGYYGEEGYPVGTQLEVFQATDTLIEGNYVGTTEDGSAKHPGWSGTGGIAVGIGAARTVVRGNLISGIVMIGTDHYQGQRFGTGLAVMASASGTIVTGNRIGVAADGVSPIPNVEGAVIQSDPNGVPQNVRFGGAALGEGNVVAFNERAGVRVGGTSTGVSIRGNSMRDNGALGIDLIGANGLPGVTPNDPLDADSGANRLQNYPVLTSASARRVAGSGRSATTVGGRLRSAPNRAYQLDFYASAAADPSGHGEGAQHLGSLTVITDAQGVAAFTASLLTPFAPGPSISATATDADGNSSEFSRALPLRLQDPRLPQ